MKEFREGLKKLPEGIDFESLSSGLADMKSSSQSLGDKPLVVLTRGKEDPFPGASPELSEKMLSSWHSMQKELTQLSTNRAHVVATNAHHFIQRDAPELVVVAVREVVESRASTPRPQRSHDLSSCTIRLSSAALARHQRGVTASPRRSRAVSVGAGVVRTARSASGSAAFAGQRRTPAAVGVCGIVQKP